MTIQSGTIVSVRKVDEILRSLARLQSRRELALATIRL